MNFFPGNFSKDCIFCRFSCLRFCYFWLFCGTIWNISFFFNKIFIELTYKARKMSNMRTNYTDVQLLLMLNLINFVQERTFSSTIQTKLIIFLNTSRESFVYSRKKKIFKQMIDDNFLFVKSWHHTLYKYLIYMHNLDNRYFLVDELNLYKLYI